MSVVTAETPSSLRPCVRQLKLDDLSAVAVLEEASYPADEAAAMSALAYRLKNAASFCHCLTHPSNGNIIGFVLGTCTTHNGPMEASSMHVHESDGDTLCIHSVVIAEQYRLHGYGLFLMGRYMDRIEQMPQIKQVRLIAKPVLVPFYQRARFEILGVSAIVHGQDEWIEMTRDLNET